MFRRKEDEEIASASQSNPTAAPLGAAASASGLANAKPATPAFGAFAPANTTNIEPEAKKPAPATAPLTTSQVGLGSTATTSPAFNPAASIVPKPAAAAAAPAYAKPASQSSSSKLEGIEAERRLTVGYGITLTGEVSDCDRLVIYGKVNAKLQNVKFLQISDSGKFNGSAAIEQAEISGVFEGDLKVSNNITITSTGRVNGKITYGSIEIRPGGKFTGEIIEDTSALGANNQQGSQSSAFDSGNNQYGLQTNGSDATSEAA